MRKLLDHIIHTNSGNNWWKPELFEEKIKDKLPKELKILKPPPDEKENYNCFIYVLGLSDDKSFIEKCNGFIYDTFFQKLLDKGELEYTDSPRKGDYILYKDLKKYPDMITHVGILQDDDVIVSKWAWGPLIKHKIFDVPESYGSDISYVKAISKEKARELYKNYEKFNLKSA